MSAFILLIMAWADPQPWMKVDNPDELPVMLRTSGCPHSEEKYRDLAEGILIASGLRPVEISAIGNDRLLLRIALECARFANDGYFYQLDVYFSVSQDADAELYRWPIHGTFGLSKPKQLNEAVSEEIQDAIAAYLETNYQDSRAIGD